MKRYSSVIGLRSEKLEEYKKLHQAVWSSVLKTISECNIHNYSIYYFDNILLIAAEKYRHYKGTQNA